MCDNWYTRKKNTYASHAAPDPNKIIQHHWRCILVLWPRRFSGTHMKSNSPAYDVLVALLSIDDWFEMAGLKG